jgi:hypothetical protein
MNPKPHQAVLEPEPGLARRPAYDPNNLHPLDEEARKHDPDDGIDYDEIIASTQDDYLAGNYVEFNPENYPTREAMIKALEAYNDEYIRTGKL